MFSLVLACTRDDAEPLAPARWVRWALAPEGCDVEVPTQLSVVAPVTFSPCPFQENGCEALGAPFAAQAGWGYGGRLEANGRFLTFTRAAMPEGTFETLVLEDRIVVAAFRQTLPRARCVLGTVSVRADGFATVPLLLQDAETAPVVVLGPIHQLMRRAERVERFGGAAAVLPMDFARTSDERLVLKEHGGRFAVRELRTGRTTRPEPPGPYRELLGATPVESAVLYTVWRGDRSSVWSTAGHSLLDSPTESFDGFVTDGHDAVWLRSTGFTAINTFSQVELWAGTLEGATLTGAHRVVALAPGPLPLLQLGEGHVVVWRGSDEVRVVRVRDAHLSALPAVPTLEWDGGPGGIAIADAHVWARASLSQGPGNDFRLIARFALEGLPPFVGTP
jgi:hypothetical protein